MSANPNNASLGLPENGLPENESPDREPKGGSTPPSSNTVALKASPSPDHVPGHEALQALLAFSSLHEQLRQRRALEKSGEPLGGIL